MGKTFYQLQLNEEEEYNVGWYKHHLYESLGD